MSNRRLLMQILRIYIFFACNEIASMNYTITTQTYSTPQTFTVGDYTATIDADKIVTNVDAITSSLTEGDSVYVIDMANSISDILTTLSNLKIYIYIDNSESTIEITDDSYQFNFIQLYIYEGIMTFRTYNYNIGKFISPTLISLRFNRSSINQTLLGTDLPKLQTLDTFANFDKIEIVNSQDLTEVNLNYISYLDLHGCPNTTLKISAINLQKYINLNGCSSVTLNIVDIDNNFTFVDFTNVNSIGNLEVDNIDFTNENFSGILLAKEIIGISLRDCIAGNLDLKSINCAKITIERGTYDNISVLDNLDMLSISNIPNKLSIKSAKSVFFDNCDVSCELVQSDNYNSGVKSYYNKGIIGDVILSNNDNFTLSIYECNSISVTNCTNISMNNPSANTSIFTYAKNSISFTNCTFKSFVIDYLTESVELSNCSWIESGTNQRSFAIKNCDKTIEEFSFFPLSKCDTVVLFNCPNFIFDDSTPESVSFINSNTTKLPNSSDLLIINCDLTNYNGQCGNLFMSNCNNLQSLDLTNVSYGYIYCNKNLKYFIVDGKSYGTDYPVDDYVSKNIGKFIFRLNGFENVNYISNPNFINGKLRYDDSYIIPINQPSDLYNNIEGVSKNGIISINGDFRDHDEFFYSTSMYGLYIITNNNPIVSKNDFVNYIVSDLTDSDIDNIINNISLTRLVRPVYIASDEETIRKLEERLINNPDRSNIILMSTSDSNSDSISNLFSINLVINY